MKQLVLGLAMLVAWGTAWSEACHVIIQEGALTRQTVQGRVVYVVDAADVKPDQCFKPVETAQEIKKYRQQLDDALTLGQSYAQSLAEQKQLNDSYRQLVQRHEQTLNQSITVAQGLDLTTRKYRDLTQDYEQLSVKFDQLAGKYRDVALTMGSPFSVEMGGGMTSRGDAIGVLGAGFNVYKTWDVKAWGVLHKDFSALLVGAGFRF